MEPRSSTSHATKAPTSTSITHPFQPLRLHLRQRCLCRYQCLKVYYKSAPLHTSRPAQLCAYCATVDSSCVTVLEGTEVGYPEPTTSFCHQCYPERQIPIYFVTFARHECMPATVQPGPAPVSYSSPLPKKKKRERNNSAPVGFTVFDVRLTKIAYC